MWSICETDRWCVFLRRFRFSYVGLVGLASRLMLEINGFQTEHRHCPGMSIVLKNVSVDLWGIKLTNYVVF